MKSFNNFSKRGFAQMLGLLSVAVLTLAVFGAVLIFKNNTNSSSQASQGNTVTVTGKVSFSPEGEGGITSGPTYALTNVKGYKYTNLFLINPTNLDLKIYLNKKVTIKGIADRGFLTVLSISPAPPAP